MSITRVKKMFIFFINLSLRKRQISYKRSGWLQTLETEIALKKRKKKRRSKKRQDNLGLHFYYKLVFRSLAKLGGGCHEDVGPLPLRSSLVGILKVTRKISMLWEASFSLDWSLRAARGSMVSWATSLVTSIGFLATSGSSASLDGLWTEEKALGGLSLPTSASLKVVSALEPEKL